MRAASSGGEGIGVVAAVRGEDEDGVVELGRCRLVAQHHLGEVGAGQVGEDDPVGGVPALGELAAELAGHVARDRRPPRATRARVSAVTLSASRSARETVAMETPARLATSRMVVAMAPLSLGWSSM